MDAFMQMLLHPIGCLVVGLWILFAAALSWHEAKHIGSFTYILSRATFVIAGLAFSRAYVWGILTVWIDSGERIHDVRPADVEAVLFQWDGSLGWVFLTGAALWGFAFAPILRWDNGAPSVARWAHPSRVRIDETGPSPRFLLDEQVVTEYIYVPGPVHTN
jgi:hypothetical protein